MFRISYISNAEERKNKYQLFNTSYITEGMRKTKLRFGEYGMGFYFLYLLISHRFYNLALLIIQLKHKSHSNQNSQYTII